jgi:hypothetical protein
MIIAILHEIEGQLKVRDSIFIDFIKLSGGVF